VEEDAMSDEKAAHPVSERGAVSTSGWFGVIAGIVLLVGAAFAITSGSAPATVALGILLVVLGVVVFASLAIVQPGQTVVVQFFGRYIGTVRRTGLVWLVPLSSRKRVSVRVRNFETSKLKVNDQSGNPVELAAIVVWRVRDTAEAVFSVDDFAGFVAVQSEAALRHTATTHPYDAAEGISLRGSTDVVAQELAEEVSARVALAGVEIVEVRISHLAYAPEIAQAMLRRQQADAVVAARSRIVEGAVGMVELALHRLGDSDLVEFDDERKASMVSNLMVVLCGDQPATPIVNAGTLYSA
jgi:regulator of protease activity HflC (stomatin/prohibitin superfamily)